MSFIIVVLGQTRQLKIARRQKTERIIVALPTASPSPLTIGKVEIVISGLSPPGIAVAAIEATRLVASARQALVVVECRTRT